jgi:hypothetical protein
MVSNDRLISFNGIVFPSIWVISFVMGLCLILGIDLEGDPKNFCPKCLGRCIGTSKLCGPIVFSIFFLFWASLIGVSCVAGEILPPYWY